MFSLTHTLFLIHAICIRYALSSSYNTNGYFPYTPNEEVGKSWKGVVDMQHSIKEPFSCEHLYGPKHPLEKAFINSDAGMIPSHDWLNTETIRKPPTIVITRESPKDKFLLDIGYSDFSVVLDIPNGYPESKCYIVPPYKPLSYITFHPYNANIDIYALRDDSNDAKNVNPNKTCNFDVSILSECQIVGPPLTYDKPTHPFFLTASRKERDEISAFTIITMERLERLVYLAESWGGPVSAAVSIVNMTDEIPTLVDAWMNTPILRRNVDIHLMFDDKAQIIKEKIQLFPINYLRNIAAKNTRTDHIIFIEGDYVVPDNFREVLTKYKPELHKDGKAMLIAFAFDGSGGLDPKKIPKTKQEFVDYINKNREPRIEAKNCSGYRPLNARTWMKSKKMYGLNFDEGSFIEPYYLTDRNIQLYDETVITWGYDKVTQVFDMRKLGYKLKVMPDAYMVHLSHNDIKNYRKWNTKFNIGPRYQVKVGTTISRRAAFPGLLTNTYYPEWLENVTVCLTDKTVRVSMLNDEIYLAKKSIALYKRLLKLLMVCFPILFAFLFSLFMH